MAKSKVKATRIQLFKRDSGWYFRLKAANGEVIAPSEAYRSRKAALETATGLAPDAIVEAGPKTKNNGSG